MIWRDERLDKHEHDRFAALAHPEWYQYSLTLFWKRTRAPLSTFAGWIRRETERLVVEQMSTFITREILSLVHVRPLEDVPEEIRDLVRQVRESYQEEPE